MVERLFTDEELIDCLRLAAQEVGGILTSDRFTVFGRGRTLPDGRPWPTSQAVQLRWGWRNGLAQAGLRANPSSAIAGQRLFDLHDCLDAMRACKLRTGKVTVTAYERFSKGMGGGVPSASTIRKQASEMGLKWSDLVAQLFPDPLEVADGGGKHDDEGARGDDA